MIWNHNEKTEKITFYFNKKVCGNCKLKQKCTVQENRTITISEHYELLKKAREYNKTDQFKEDMKQRAHIEPKQGEMKRHPIINQKAIEVPGAKKQSGDFGRIRV